MFARSVVQSAVFVLSIFFSAHCALADNNKPINSKSPPPLVLTTLAPQSTAHHSEVLPNNLVNALSVVKNDGIKQQPDNLAIDDREAGMDNAVVKVPAKELTISNCMPAMDARVAHAQAISDFSQLAQFIDKTGKLIADDSHSILALFHIDMRGHYCFTPLEGKVSDKLDLNQPVRILQHDGGTLFIPPKNPK